jgi:hypothetical protein
MQQAEEEDPNETSASPKKPAASRSKASSPKKKKKAPSATQPTSTALVASELRVATPAREFLLGEPVPPLSDAEYHNLTALMLQFCKVPLLAEFRRPVAILHPEVRTLTIDFYVLFIANWNTHT